MRIRAPALAAATAHPLPTQPPRLTPEERDYVAALAHFVHDYERQTLRSQFGRLKPVELLKHLMTENRMNTSDLGAILGSRGLASEVLNGKRGLSAHRQAVAPVPRRSGTFSRRE